MGQNSGGMSRQSRERTQTASKEKPFGDDGSAMTPEVAEREKKCLRRLCGGGKATFLFFSRPPLNETRGSGRGDQATDPFSLPSH